MPNPRMIAVKALIRVEKDSAYSNITLNSFLKESGLTGADKALTSALFYGTLDRKITLDYYLSEFIKTPLKKVAPFTLNALRTGVYQIAYMDKIPDSAAVNETVKLIKNSKESRNSGFVNAVLRNILRGELTLPEGDSVKELSVRYSCPEWIINSFIDDYGSNTARLLLEESLKPAPVVLRVNTVKTDTEALINKFTEFDINANMGKMENTIILDKGLDIADNPLYKEGLFFAEDLASAKAIRTLNPKPNERLLDICAAPGGKSFLSAILMENKGEVISCDLYENRVNLIKSGAERLGLDIVKTAVSDASVYNNSLGEFDCIICDVPCSGLGVLRRKPDIKYKVETDFKELENIQRNILKNALKYLKKGGRLLYSTCTLRSAENEKLVNSVIMEYNEFQKQYECTLMPHIDKTDGFYFALIVKDC